MNLGWGQILKQDTKNTNHMWKIDKFYYMKIKIFGSSKELREDESVSQRMGENIYSRKLMKSSYME